LRRSVIEGIGAASAAADPRHRVDIAAGKIEKRLPRAHFFSQQIVDVKGKRLHFPKSGKSSKRLDMNILWRPLTEGERPSAAHKSS
jgi:hypothetical protein